MTRSKVWLELYPYTREELAPIGFPISLASLPQLVHIFLTSLNAPTAPPEMEPSLSEGDCIEMWLGRYEGMRGLVVKVIEKMVKVNFDLTDREVRVWKTSIIVLEEEDDSAVRHPVLNVPPVARLETRVSKDKRGRLPVAHLISA
jgi:hypothetical protein